MAGRILFSGEGAGIINLARSLVLKIPKNWARIDGKVYPSEELVNRGRIAEGTILSLNPQALPPTYGGFRITGDLFELLSFQKLPAAVEFVGAEQGGFKPLELGLRLLAFYLTAGYDKGDLQIYSRTFGHDLNAYRERVTIFMRQWQPKEIGLAAKKGQGLMPPSVCLQWLTERGGNKHRLSKLTEICADWGMKKVIP